jgi:hypothetical protein
MPLVEMKPEDVLAAIEEYSDALSGEQEKIDAFYRQFICPSCKCSALSKRYQTRHAFADSNWLIPRATLVCNQCKCQFDPHTGIILEMGNPAKVEAPYTLIDH